MADTTPTLREAAQRLLNAIEAVHEAEKSEGHARGGFVRTAPTRAHQRRVAEAWHENAAAVQALRAALAEQDAEQASAVQAVDALNTWHPVRLEFGVTMHRDHNPPSGGEWLKKDEVLAAVAGAAPAAEQAEPVAVPAGYALVPVEPTEAMLAAAHEGDRQYTLRNFGDVMTVMQGPYDHWHAMIAAAPPAPARQEPVSRTIDLWFFRELSDEQRMSLFRMAGLPADDIRSDATQRQCLRHILGAAPARQEPLTDEQIDATAAEWESSRRSFTHGDGTADVKVEFTARRLRHFVRAVRSLPAAPVTAAPAEGGAA